MIEKFEVLIRIEKDITQAYEESVLIETNNNHAKGLARIASSLETFYRHFKTHLEITNTHLEDSIICMESYNIEEYECLSEQSKFKKIIKNCYLENQRVLASKKDLLPPSDSILKDDVLPAETKEVEDLKIVVDHVLEKCSNEGLKILSGRMKRGIKCLSTMSHVLIENNNSVIKVMTIGF